MLRNALLILLIVNSLGVIGVWIAEFATGNATLGRVFQPATDMVILAPHAVTMLATAAVLAFGRGRLLRVGLGMATYAALNELSWAVVIVPWAILPLVAALVLAARARPRELAALAVVDAALVYEPFKYGLLAAAPVPSVLAPHLLAEAMMAIVPLVGAITLLRGRAGGMAVLELGIGAGLVAAPCAAGWAIVNQPVVLAPMAFAVALDVALLFTLAREGGRWRDTAEPPAASCSSSA